MSRVHVLKIGPFDDGNSIYLPIGHEVPTTLEPVAALDDVAGLQAIFAQNPTDEIVCSPELAGVAAARGLRVEEPPAVFEGTRIQLALQHAQGDDLDGLESMLAYLLLMNGVRDFVNARIAHRWPAKQPFDVELRGDRSCVWAGWITDGVEPTVTLVRSRADADALVSASADQRETRLASLDHLAIRLVKPPKYALEPIRGFYGIEVMPRFDKVEQGERRLPKDEDAFVIGGVLGALAKSQRVDEIATSESESPGRKVRTLVGATLDASRSRVD